MSFSRLIILAAGLSAVPGFASAQSVLDRALAAGANGPVVLQQDPDLSPPGKPRVALNGDPAIAEAVPVPNVMNGGGFGYTGYEYFSDATRPGRVGRRREVNEIILVPTLRRPLP